MLFKPNSFNNKNLNNIFIVLGQKLRFWMLHRQPLDDGWSDCFKMFYMVLNINFIDVKQSISNDNSNELTSF